MSIRLLLVGLFALPLLSARGDDGSGKSRLEPILMHAWTPIVISNQAGVFRFWLESSLANTEDSNTRFTGRVEVHANPQVRSSAAELPFDSVIVSFVSPSYEVISELRETGLVTSIDDQSCGLSYVWELDTCLVRGTPDSILVSAYVAARGYLDSAVVEESIPITMCSIGHSDHHWWSTTGRLLQLEQPQPYPFGPITTLGYSVPRAAHVVMTIWDGTGAVDTLVDQNHVAGYYRVDLKTLNKRSGIYFYSLEIEGYEREIRKMVIMK